MSRLFFMLFVFSTILYCGTDPVKGVWLTNVDSDALRSRIKIAEAVDYCAEAGINTIFVVTWNKGFTIYQSKIMEDMFGVSIYPDFAGRDPLQDLIEEAHAKNIKVIAWFEFGFASSYSLNGGHLIKLNPHWKAIDKEGNLVSKNNFEWMNGFHPEVQDFMLSLVLEVVKNYDIDGIQGDDRLPAMPSEAGYDDYTVGLYKKAHNGKTPPEDNKDKNWLQWRADLLTDYMGRIYNEVKKIKPNCIVSMAPSIYPWALEEYLQDWPEWMKRGYVEMICPQLYRYDLPAYKLLLDDILANQIKKEDYNKFFPGILIKVGSYYPSEHFLKEMIDLNRKNGINGEVFFFYEGMKKFDKYFKEEYKNK